MSAAAKLRFVAQQLREQAYELEKVAASLMGDEHSVQCLEMHTFEGAVGRVFCRKQTGHEGLHEGVGPQDILYVWTPAERFM